jgi:elongation factor Ts
LVSAQQVKELREITGAGMMDCKKALEECSGDIEKAIDFLRKKGITDATKKAGRVAQEGLVEAYIHLGGKIGVLVEVNCETDFVARTDEFKSLTKDIAMQIAAYSPKYVKREEVPAQVIEEEKEIFKNQALNEGKPENVIDRIVEGRIEKYYAEVCLLEQPYVRDDKKKVEEVIKEKIALLGENIEVNRFCRFEVGEALDKKSSCS